ncbi:MAG: hypothetical protein WDA16_07840 [Candidatus Thermoplasmatota archaeon]
MTVEALSSGKIDPPPPKLLQYYLELVGRVGRLDKDVDPADVEQMTGSGGAARQVGHLWPKHRLAVRLRFGEYALVDPSVAIRAWGVPAYYAELLTLHDVLETRKIPHAFACLTAATNADYVPERPLLVTPHDEERRTERLDAIRYDFRKADTMYVTLDVLGKEIKVPALVPREAAVVLAALGTPREISTARTLAEDPDLPDETARKLNHFGLRLKPSVFRSENPRIGLPEELKKRRARLAESLLAEGIE